MNKTIYPEGIKTLLVERDIECPMCSKELFKGDVLYKDNYREETFCADCSDDYEEAIVSEEGEYGEKLN